MLKKKYFGCQWIYGSKLVPSLLI